jgi:hypothetical protein
VVEVDVRRDAAPLPDEVGADADGDAHRLVLAREGGLGDQVRQQFVLLVEAGDAQVQQADVGERQAQHRGEQREAGGHQRRA